MNVLCYFLRVLHSSISWWRSGHMLWQMEAENWKILFGLQIFFLVCLFMSAFSLSHPSWVKHEAMEHPLHLWPLGSTVLCVIHYCTCIMHELVAPPAPDKNRTRPTCCWSCSSVHISQLSCWDCKSHPSLTADDWLLLSFPPLQFEDSLFTFYRNELRKEAVGMCGASQPIIEGNGSGSYYISAGRHLCCGLLLWQNIQENPRRITHE